MVNSVNSPLIICVGNPSRGDDAAGPLIAQALSMLTPSLNVIETFQLQPELVEDMVGHTTVIVVDAQANSDQALTLRRIEPADTLGWCSHALAPEQLLGLYQTAYGLVEQPTALPEMITLGIQANNFELGAPVSEMVLSLIGPVTHALVNLTEALSHAPKKAGTDVLQFLQELLAINTQPLIQTPQTLNPQQLHQTQQLQQALLQPQQAHRHA